MGDTVSVLLKSDIVDENNFQTIYRHYKPKLARYAQLRGARDPEGMADLALFDGYRAIGRLNNRSEPAFNAYLYRSIRNRIVSDSRRSDPMPSELDEEMLVIDDPADASLDHLWLHELIEDLPEGQRAVIRSRFFLELTGPEAGHRLGKDPNAVYQLQHRALAALRRKIEDSGLDLAALRVIILAILIAGGALIAIWYESRATSTQPISSTEQDRKGDEPQRAEPPNNPDQTESAPGGGFVEAVERPGNESPTTEPDSDAGPDERSSGPNPSPPPTATVTASSSTTIREVPTAATAPPTASSSTTIREAPTATTTPVTTATDQGELVSLSGTIAIRSVLTGDYLWVRASDITLRSNQSSATADARFTIVPISGSVFALQASVGDKGRQIAVQETAENTLRAGGSAGERRKLLVYRMNDGTYRFESVRHPGRYLRVDGNTIDSVGTISSGPETRFEIIEL